MCLETIALCESCGFHRHIHYHLCMAWIWSFHQIKWTFTTPFDGIPKAKNCPFLDGEVAVAIKPGSCPNAHCPGHQLRKELEQVSIDTRTKEEKIEAQRITMGLKKRIRSQGFREPLEVGRPHQRKPPTIVMEVVHEEHTRRERETTLERAREKEAATDTEQAGGITIPSCLTSGQAPVRRARDLNGPMMMPH
ncbi:hypothetical protein CCHL11_07860 [Colletotrichum chlorophyti]|uniref:Uncharacterized protein n=1 Tax=Colletotrichum chlorophyti TaxID=708187 RepID=A0A1Q8RR13_9PEZI|nr:hypothetical protein CCHL11_07860 [Colletotrichum chlorophyti]